MELTPQRLREVEFRTALRGYDEEEVDTFLEEVGAGIARLQAQLKEASERLRDAEARASSGSEAEDTLRRTLVLAQRTADAAVAEAKQEADDIVRTARAEADHLSVEARVQSEAIRAEAEEEARRVVEATRAPLLEEIRELEEVRNFLREDVVLLEEHLRAERQRLSDTVASIARLLDDPDSLRPGAPPALSGVELDDDETLDEAQPLFADGGEYVEDGEFAAPAADDLHGDEIVEDLYDDEYDDEAYDLAYDDEGDDEESSGPIGVVAAAGESGGEIVDAHVVEASGLGAEPLPVTEVHDQVDVDDFDDDDVVVGELVDDARPGVFDRPGDRPTDWDDEPTDFDDSFLEELRRAVGDDEPDAAEESFFGGETGEGQQGFFGRRS